MAHYFFRLVNAIFVGPNPEVHKDCAGAYVNCIVHADDQVTATELLIADLRDEGFLYESAEEVMEISEAIEKFDLEFEAEELDDMDGVSYDSFHCYPHNA